MKYLSITNPGVAPAESFTLLGASTKRGSDNANTIGKFGSGNKFSVTTLLRNNLAPIVLCGNLRMEFSTRSQRVNDGIKNNDFNRVVVKYGGKNADGKSCSATEDLGFVLEYGATDWQSTDLALREFVSNSIDRTTEEGEFTFATKWLIANGTEDMESALAALLEYRKTAHDYDNVHMEITENVRAKDGFTRVFIPLDDTVEAFYRDRGKWFLHFNEPHLLTQAILPKAGRNIGDAKVAVIYRRGVRVREFQSYNAESLFDYNLENLDMDESRKVDDYSAMHAAARALRTADRRFLETYFRSFISTKKFWEHDFSSTSLAPDPYRQTEEVRTQQSKNWQDAFSSVSGLSGVLAVKDTGEMAARKGFKVLEAPESVVYAAEQHGIRTPSTVLSLDDRDGRDVTDATHDGQLSVDYLWSILSSLNLTNGKDKPSVKSFSQIMHAESQTLGFYRDCVVYLNIDIASAASKTESGNMLSRQLLATSLEEIGHYVTGATDNSRDFQDYAFVVAAALVSRLQS